MTEHTKRISPAEKGGKPHTWWGGHMTKKRSVMIKIGLIAVLSVVMGSILLFRFMKLQSAFDVASSAPSPMVKLGVPLAEIVKDDGNDQVQTALRALDQFLPRDIFQPPEAPSGDETPDGGKKTGPPRLTLKGTILGGQRPIAVINNQFVSPGDMIGDLRVASIEKDRVVLRAKEEEIVLDVMKNARQ